MKKMPILYSLLFFLLLLIQTVQAEDYTNTLGMKFKNISPGFFYMGSCKLSEFDKEVNRKRQFMGLPAMDAACPSGAGIDSDAYDDETPQHRVDITKGFQMGVYEVSLRHFKNFIADTGRLDLLTDDFMQCNSNGEDAAVTMVSRDDAQAFIRWLNKKEGGELYRLPTEAEWEYAARAGAHTIYFWGNSTKEADTYAWYHRNTSCLGDDYAHAVGLKQPNPWGLYDMQGNVWEWVQDWYSEDYYRNSPPKDPSGPDSGLFGVARGGNWSLSVRFLRSASRERISPMSRNCSCGFRLVRQP